MAKGKIFEVIATQYDKIIAIIIMIVLGFTLIFLSFKVAQIKVIVKNFEDEIATKKPAFPDTVKIKIDKYDKALGLLDSPDRVDRTAWGTNFFLIPQARYTCALLDCGKPIIWDDSKCAFCGTEQPVDKEKAPEWDGDGDGIWDSWEQEYKIDQEVPGHAMADMDGDKYSNYAEFKAGTDPTDPKSLPPVEQELSLVRISINPFKLRFKSVMTLPGGGYRFGLNTRANKTHFVNLNQEVDGFKILSYEQKTNIVEKTPGIKKKEKADILTLKKEDAIIPLVFDKEVQINEYRAHLYFRLDDTNIEVKVKDTFKLFDNSYEVLSIDSKQQLVVISRTHDHKEIVVGKIPGKADSSDKMNKAADPVAAKPVRGKSASPGKPPASNSDGGGAVRNDLEEKVPKVQNSAPEKTEKGPDTLNKSDNQSGDIL